MLIEHENKCFVEGQIINKSFHSFCFLLVKSVYEVTADVIPFIDKIKIAKPFELIGFIFTSPDDETVVLVRSNVTDSFPLIESISNLIDGDRNHSINCFIK